jgi:hypothetical protein
VVVPGLLILDQTEKTEFLDKLDSHGPCSRDVAWSTRTISRNASSVHVLKLKHEYTPGGVRLTMLHGRGVGPGAIGVRKKVLAY